MNLARTLGTGVALAAAALVIATPLASADQQPSTTVKAPAPSAAPAVTPAPKAPEGQIKVQPKGAPETGGGPAEGSDLAVWIVGAAGLATVGAGGALALRRRRVTS
ncbi:hypothetical protein [Alloactinosynnema sp. L-07]|uniref:hypothetical protein n=1 Tax=Alloactinosynnema sp. L-07 TaxID=1653480 RepID=UPI00065EEFE3|nr:hypothetical protein [Alloactinosynnema sp. L-07]CRK57973.1 hypothetical protein [Alloactinosynnema sp. L-07]